MDARSGSAAIVQGDADLRARMDSSPRRDPAIRLGAEELDLSRDLGADLMAALEYWRRKKGERLAPARCDIDPLDIAALLPRVTLVDVQAGAPEFRYRLAGTGVVKVHAMELTNRGPRDLRPAAYGAMVHQHYVQGVMRRAPLAHRVTLAWNGAGTAYCRIILPLSDDGGAINRLMTVDNYEEDGGRGLQSCLTDLAAAE